MTTSMIHLGYIAQDQRLKPLASGEQMLADRPVEGSEVLMRPL